MLNDKSLTIGKVIRCRNSTGLRKFRILMISHTSLPCPFEWFSGNDIVTGVTKSREWRYLAVAC